MPIIDELIAVVEVRDDASAALQKIERESLKNAQALARVRAASGDVSGAATILRNALDEAAVVNYRHGLQVEAQIARYEAAAERTSRWNQALGALSGIGLTLSAAAVLDVAQRTGEFIVSANEAARATERAQATLRVLTGSQEEYAATIALAKEQQKLFGGSLSENIEKLSGLTVAAKQSGADLGALLDLAQRLSVLSPEQGISGARVALSEALSGNIRSIAERFEIPKDSIRDLADTSLTAADRLRVLDEYLNAIGVTSEAVGGSIPATTREVNRLNAAWEEVTLTIGRGADPAIRQVSSATADMLQDVNTGLQIAIAVREALDRKLFAPTDRAGGAWGEDIAAQARAAALEVRASAEVIEQANERIERANERGASALERLTEAEARYQEQRAELITRTNERIIDIRAQAAERERSIVERSASAIAEMQAAADERRRAVIERNEGERAAIVERAARRIEDIERARADAIAEIVAREAEERARANERIVDARARVVEALAELERGIAERAQEIAESRDERRQERAERRAERRVELERRVAAATTDEARAAAEEALRAFDAREAREEERIARREAREDEKRAREDEKRRQQIARRLADEEAAAQKELEIIARRAAEARAKEEGQARARREAAQREVQERLATLQAETQARLEEIDRRLAREIEKERAALAQRVAETRAAALEREAAERESYERAAVQAERSYARQTEQLRRALGEQIAEVVQARLALGELTPDEARARMDALRAAYGYMPSEERRRAFEDMSAAFANGVSITIQGVTDPQQVAQAVRSELLRLQRAGERIGL